MVISDTCNIYTTFIYLFTVTCYLLLLPVICNTRVYSNTNTLHKTCVRGTNVPDPTITGGIYSLLY